jgi:hypothetical protein
MSLCTLRGVWKAGMWLASTACVLTRGPITFIGDSTMMRLADTVKCKPIARAAPRCGLLKYVNQTPTTTWFSPNSHQGPVLYGAAHPFCSDCSNCLAYKCANGHEYIPIEFTSDVTYQSVKHNSTQAIVADYLAEHPRNICLVNSGIHDQQLKLSDKQFASSLKSYLQLLQRGCKRVIWLQTTAVLGKNFAQSNDRIRRWNKIATNIAIDVVDTYQMSSPVSLHTDNVHLNSSYYNAVHELLVPRRCDINCCGIGDRLRVMFYHLVRFPNALFNWGPCRSTTNVLTLLSNITSPIIYRGNNYPKFSSMPCTSIYGITIEQWHNDVDAHPEIVMKIATVLQQDIQILPESGCIHIRTGNGNDAQFESRKRAFDIHAFIEKAVTLMPYADQIYVASDNIHAFKLVQQLTPVPVIPINTTTIIDGDGHPLLWHKLRNNNGGASCQPAWFDEGMRDMWFLSQCDVLVGSSNTGFMVIPRAIAKFNNRHVVLL